MKDLFDLIASGGTDEDYILVLNRLDSICNTCPIKREHCSEPDFSREWDVRDVRFLQDMQKIDLKEGFLYSLKEFAEKVRQLYPNRNP